MCVNVRVCLISGDVRLMHLASFFFFPPLHLVTDWV